MLLACNANGNGHCKCVVAEKCDLFVGEWVPDQSGPVYTNESCRVIEPHQNCMKNGRPDSGYLHWRWSPRNCELPRFNPKKFLKFMRHKSLSFIGDSISRNQVQSLLCILSKVLWILRSVNQFANLISLVFLLERFPPLESW